jgi:glutamate N-acetyltransferase/amino-acid N-acetyltransferase
MPRPQSKDIPRGFTFSAAACGLKKSRLDLALIASDSTATAAALFTQNLVQAAPVVLSRKHLRQSKGRARAIIVNAGNANCVTGAAGMKASRDTAAELSRMVGCAAEAVQVCSTGVIGVPLAVEKILNALPGLVREASPDASAFDAVTRAIMTTDTRPKWASDRLRVGGQEVRLVGCAKGSGMIQPNMATMLAFVATDAAIGAPALGKALRAAVQKTFNAITVDGDTSTNDTIIVLANGASKSHAIASSGGDFRRFSAALETLCGKLALAIVEDGEGAKRVVGIEVRGAKTARDAETIARTVANSPLVKTAFAGGDPNWGRILAAAGRSGAKFNPDRASIALAGRVVCKDGLEVPFSEKEVSRRMRGKYVPVVLDLNAGRASARMWTCDFTEDYIRINASYRT